MSVRTDVKMIHTESERDRALDEVVTLCLGTEDLRCAVLGSSIAHAVGLCLEISGNERYSQEIRVKRVGFILFNNGSSIEFGTRVCGLSFDVVLISDADRTLKSFSRLLKEQLECSVIATSALIHSGHTYEDLLMMINEKDQQMNNNDGTNEDRTGRYTTCVDLEKKTITLDLSEFHFPTALEDGVDKVFLEDLKRWVSCNFLRFVEHWTGVDKSERNQEE